eukprot:COSAG01_NODE_159_length_23702_cov_119.507585_21_plen_203_part_00
MTLSGTADGKAPLARENASTLTSGATAATQFEVTVSTAAAQTETSEEWLASIAAQHDLAVGGATHDTQARAIAVATRVQSHRAWWSAFWSRSHIVVSASNSSSSEGSALALLTQQYAICRYVQAIQARTWVPVKFNVSSAAFHANVLAELMMPPLLLLTADASLGRAACRGKCSLRIYRRKARGAGQPCGIGVPTPGGRTRV